VAKKRGFGNYEFRTAKGAISLSRAPLLFETIDLSLRTACVGFVLFRPLALIQMRIGSWTCTGYKEEISR
jgi:hypothetical protein